MTCRHRPLGRRSAAAFARWFWLPVALCALPLAARADVWGYVDESGVAHVAHEQVDSRYHLFFREPPQPEAAELAAPASSPAPDPALEALRRTRVFQRVFAHPNVKRFEPLIETEARSSGLDPALVKAVIAVESSFEPTAVSPKGALGLMQVIPPTGARYGVSADRKRSVEQKLLDPMTNIRAGTRYLRDLLAMFEGDRVLALAAYNAGEDNVDRWRREHVGIQFGETRDYVDKVERLKKLYRRAYASQLGY